MAWLIQERSGRARRLVPVALAAVLVAAAVTVAALPAGADREAPATLEGTVTDGATSAPIAGAWVMLLRTYDYQPVAEVVADEEGAFTAEVGAGTYVVYLVDPTGAHRSGLAGAPDVIRARPGDAVTVTAAMAVTTGGLSGQVTDAVDGSAVRGAWVVALGASGAPEQAVRADSSGRYSFSALRVGPHRLAFLDPAAAHTPEYWDDATDVFTSTTVDIEPGAVATADAALSRQSTPFAFSSLRGTVTEAGTGDPLPGVLVLALRNSDLRLAGAAQTSSTGRWRINVALGGYRLAFVDATGAHAMEWHADRPFDQVGSAAVANAPAIVDADLVRTSGDLTGSVHDEETGDAVAGSWVLAIDAGGQLRGAVTDTDGSFAITSLPVGTYRAAILDTAGERRLEFWDDQRDYGAADTFTVSPGSPVVVDAHLDAADGTDALRSDAVGWWDAASGVDASGALPDLSGNGNAMALHPGSLVPGGPALLAPDPDRGRSLFSPGWDDMYLETPAPATPLAGLDVAWDADLTRVLLIDPGQSVNWVAHQGSTSDGTFSWAVGVDAFTREVVLAHSADGRQATTVRTGAVAEDGPGRTAVTLDPGTGTVAVHRQEATAAVADFDLAYDRWQTVATVPGSGPVTLFASPAPIRHSSTVDPDTVDGQWLLGWFRALYRLRVRSGVEGPAVASLDVAALPDELTWGEVGGLPPVGHVTTASVADLPGTAGDTWTLVNYDTTSYPIILVERPVLLLGNGSYGEVAVDDWAFDASAVGDLSVWVLYRDLRLGEHDLPLVAHRGREWSAPGYAIHQVPATSDAPLAHVSDGTTRVRAVPPAPVEGATTVSGLQFDRDAPFTTGAGGPALVAYTNGVPGPAEDVSLLGPVSTPDTPLRIGTWSDDATDAEGFAFVGLAVFDRTLTADEIGRLPAEFGLG